MEKESVQWITRMINKKMGLDYRDPWPPSKPEVMIANSNRNLSFIKILAFVGIISIIYIMVNIGFPRNFEPQLIRTIPSQELIDSNIGRKNGIKKQEIKGYIPEFIDEKKFQRPIVSEDRYIHDFNYNGTIWPMIQESFQRTFVRTGLRSIKVYDSSRNLNRGLRKKLLKKWRMKKDAHGDFIWIPFTQLKIEFNDAKSGWFYSFSKSCMQSATSLTCSLI